MIHYKDTTFCGDAFCCANRENCDRYLSPQDEQKAIKWWGGDDFPVAFGFFADTCGEFDEDANQPDATA